MASWVRSGWVCIRGAGGSPVPYSGLKHGVFLVGGSQGVVCSGVKLPLVCQDVGIAFVCLHSCKELYLIHAGIPVDISVICAVYDLNSCLADSSFYLACYLSASFSRQLRVPLQVLQL